MRISRPRGTNDILPGQVERWQYVEKIIRQLCAAYAYAEVRTPIFEHTELFQRGVGETTDVVEKEMYTFMDKGETSITLRPEATASTVRAFVENGLAGQAWPLKLYYQGPMFRYDRPQAGRYRQFHQFGVEVLGTRDPFVDAEVMAMAMDFYTRLGLGDLALQLNSVGCPDCRPKHREALRDFLSAHTDALCANCQHRLARNPLRILDCKEEKCQVLTASAPAIVQYLCPACQEHFKKVRLALDDLGIEYWLNDRLVRGLDYYTQTAFEITVAGIGAQSSIGGGGRYDGLVEEVGGPSTPGVGFALGIERILLALEEQGVELPGAPALDVFIVTLGTDDQRPAFVLLQRLRKLGLRANLDYLGRSLKAQMKQAGKAGARLTLIVGGEELARRQILVRDMRERQQQEIPLTELEDYLRKKLATR